MFIYLAGGCFWGMEKILGQVPGVTSTVVGYTGGHTDNPNYVQVCTGTTGHAEAVKVEYEPGALPEILATFWENHDPTQLNRQGNDIGTQYRSAIWVTDEEQEETARNIRDGYELPRPIVTTIEPLSGPFWEAEEYHQQYLAKNPGGYCNHGFNGFSCPR